MGRKLDLSSLSEDECERILQVIQRDFSIRQREKDRISQAEELLKEEDSKNAILTSRPEFNNNHCIRCYSRFFFLINSKLQCFHCHLYICRSCALWNDYEKQNICTLCASQRKIKSQTLNWFYSKLNNKFKRFGSAKVIRSLYKRRTESDSENDSGYDPSLNNNSLRLSIANSHIPTQEILREDQISDDSEDSWRRKNNHHQTILSSNKEIFRAPASHSVLSEETNRFKGVLDGIATDVTRVLESQTPEALLLIARGHPYDGSLSEYKHQINRLVNNFSQRLHTVAPPKEPLHYSSVHPILVEESQKFINSHIDLNPTNDVFHSSPKECVSNALLHFMVDSFVRRVDEKTEAKLRNDLSKLSNNCTIENLNDLLTESETDEPQSSPRSIRTDTATEISITTFDVSDQDSVIASPTLSRQGSKRVQSTYGENLDLDDLVSINEISLRSPRLSPRSVTPNRASNDLTLLQETDISPAIAITVSSAVDSSSKPDSRNIRSEEAGEEVFSDSDGTIPCGSARQTPDIEHASTSLFMSESVLMSRNDDEITDPLEFVQHHSIPLPSFDADACSDIGIDEVDLDDISRHDFDVEGGSRNAEDRESPSQEINEMVSNTTTSSLFASISAYDNAGEKKVGRLGGAPTLMFVPQYINQNEGENDESSSSLGDIDEDDDDEKMTSEEDEFDYAKEMTKERSFSSRKTPHLNEPSEQLKVMNDETTKQTEQNAVDPEKVCPVTDSSQTDDELPVESSDDEEVEIPVDAAPQFTRKPRSLRVESGEHALITCSLSSSTPVDIFWYKDKASVEQLDESEKYGIVTEANKSTLTIYNATEEDRGRYLCIGINEAGQTNRRVKLLITEPTNERKFPAFLKEISDIDILEGQTARFRCKVTGIPHPRISWYKDGQRINVNGPYKQNKIGNRDYQLVIDNVSLEDDAEFTVSAVNSSGTVKSSAQLLVNSLMDNTTNSSYNTNNSSSKQIIEPPLMSPIFQSELKADESTDQYDDLYPQPSQLLRLAEQVSSTRGEVISTASDILNSADELSSINRQIDEMDDKLVTMEADCQANHLDDDFLSSSTILNQTPFRNSANSLSDVTSSALEVISSASDNIELSDSAKSANRTSQPTEVDSQKVPKLELDSTFPEQLSSSDKSPEEVDLKLSYIEFERLLENKIITKEQLKRGRVFKSDLRKIQDFLASDTGNGEEISEETTLLELEFTDGSPSKLLSSLDSDINIDCGLKRVNSKRYKRDYVINNTPKLQRRKWEVPLRSDSKDDTLTQSKTLEISPNQSQSYPEKLRRTEENVYIAASQTISLENRVKDLQARFSSPQIQSPTSLTKMAEIEKEISETAAQVAESNNKVWV